MPFREPLGSFVGKGLHHSACFIYVRATDVGIKSVTSHFFEWTSVIAQRIKAGAKFLLPKQTQATSPSGFSHSSLNTFISSAPSAPSMARWSKLPVALITVAICKASSTT